MKEEELINQCIFFKYKKDVWYDRSFDFQIRFELGMAVLYHHCEMEGDVWFIKYLKNLEDLKKVYEAITNETLNITGERNDIELWKDVYEKIKETIIDKGMPGDYVDWSVCISLLSELYKAPTLK